MIRYTLLSLLLIAVFFQAAAQDRVVLANDSVMELDEPARGEFQGRYLMLGFGMGGRYSGLMGVMANVRLGGETGVGFHGGIGFIPMNTQLVYNAGIKFYPKGGFFLNGQFGLIHVGEEFDDWDWEYYKKRYFGPTFLLGYEKAWGGDVKFGFSLGGGVSWEIGNQVLPMLELGFVIQLPLGNS